jgi:hypothetical protein
VRGGVKHGYNPSRAVVSNYFPYELGFVMTLYKAQGQTLSNVILALTHRPTHFTQMKFAGIFVALSRVRQSQDIRLLLPNPSDYSVLHYITELKAPQHINQYFAGFAHNGTTWNAQLAYNARLADNIKCHQRNLVGHVSMGRE